jgi:hypothetical protein
MYHNFILLSRSTVPTPPHAFCRYLISQLFKMSLVPLLEVTWPMFFLGDQLCSHSRLLNDFFVFSCVSITNPSYSNISQYFVTSSGEPMTSQDGFCFRAHSSSFTVCCLFPLKMLPDVADTRTCFNPGAKTAIRICSGCLPLVIRCVLLTSKSSTMPRVVVHA